MIHKVHSGPYRHVDRAHLSKGGTCGDINTRSKVNQSVTYYYWHLRMKKASPRGWKSKPGSQLAWRRPRGSSSRSVGQRQDAPLVQEPLPGGHLQDQQGQDRQHGGPAVPGLGALRPAPFPDRHRRRKLRPLRIICCKQLLHAPEGDQRLHRAHCSRLHIYIRSTQSNGFDPPH